MATTMGEEVVAKSRKEQLNHFLIGLKQAEKMACGKGGRDAAIRQAEQSCAFAINFGRAVGMDVFQYLIMSYGIACLREELAKLDAAPTN